MTGINFPADVIELGTLNLTGIGALLKATATINFQIEPKPGEVVDIPHDPTTQLAIEFNSESKWIYQGGGIATRSFTEK